jgi:Rieske Fe-S protein
MSLPEHQPTSADECADCPLMDRRSFLRDAGTAAAAGLAAIGIVSGTVAGMPVSPVSPVYETGEEKAYPIPAVDGVQIDRNLDTIVARTGGKVYVFSLACPHQNTAIKWQADKNRFECPKHKSRYTPDGTFIEGRATRGLDRFDVKKVGNTVVANLDRVYQEKDNKDQWQAAFITV